MADDAQLPDLEAAFRALPIGVCVLDPDLRFVYANPRYAEINRSSRTDLAGLRLDEVLTEPALSRASRIAQRVLDTGEPFRGAERRQQSEEDRPGKIWRVSAHPLRVGDETRAVVATILDVTDVRLAEEEASAALRELEAIYRNAPVGLSFVDRELRYLRVNQAIADMNGRTIEEVVGRTYRDLSPETADEAEPLLHGLMDRGEPVRNMEVRSRPPADPEREHRYLLSMECVRDAEGKVVGHTSVVQDVTELREAEVAAAERMRQLAVVYEHTPVGLCHMDSDLRVVQMNRRFADICLPTGDERSGAHATTLFPEEIARKLLPQLSFVARSGRSSFGLELRGSAPGTTRDATWIAQTHPLTNESGEVSGIVTVVQDVSQFAELRRDAEATRDRLAEAQKIAQIGSWEWSLVADEIWWSRELYEIFDEPPTYTPTYEAFFEHVHRDDRGEVRALIERVLESEESFRTTFRIVRPDGSERVLLAIARLERAPSGAAARLYGTFQDVTDYPVSAPAGS